MPGIRQISPYFAGFAKIPFREFLLLSFFGTLLWTIPIISVGYYAGTIFKINPQYVSYLGLVFLIIFLIYVSFKYLKRKKKKVKVS
jgi:membrane protein DedA with SNARE-associated domain